MSYLASGLHTIVTNNLVHRGALWFTEGNLVAGCPASCERLEGLGQEAADTPAPCSSQARHRWAAWLLANELLCTLHCWVQSRTADFKLG